VVCTLASGGVLVLPVHHWSQSVGSTADSPHALRWRLCAPATLTRLPRVQGHGRVRRGGAPERLHERLRALAAEAREAGDAGAGLPRLQARVPTESQAVGGTAAGPAAGDAGVQRHGRSPGHDRRGAEASAAAEAREEAGLGPPEEPDGKRQDLQTP